MNFDALALGPQYRTFGVDAVLKIGTPPVTLRVIPRMTRYEAEVDVGSVGTMKPRAMCRRSDLDALAIAPEDLKDNTITINGADWLITSAKPDPGPNGKGTGEVILTLRNEDL